MLGIWAVALNNLRNIKYKKASKASLSMGGLVLGQNTDDIKLGELSQGHLCRKSQNTLVKMMAKQKNKSHFCEIRKFSFLVDDIEFVVEQPRGETSKTSEFPSTSTASTPSKQEKAHFTRFLF